MSPFQVGQLVRVLSNVDAPMYRVGQTYTVDAVDTSDSTVRLSRPGERSGAWLGFAAVEATELGWLYAKRVLPPEALTLLEGCAGIEGIRLKPEVRDAILRSLPDLPMRVRSVVERSKAST